MNVFILCTGRCGSVSLIEACRHIKNFTCGHEERAGFIGDDRLDYPQNHIEADNRLSWYLGRLHFKYGDDAKYVFLTRDMDATAASYSRRSGVGIMNAFASGLLRKKTMAEGATEPLPLAREICETASANIEHFLADKSKVYRMTLENLNEDFKGFWEFIDAEGDLNAALATLDKPHNTSDDFKRNREKRNKASYKVIRVIKRFVAKVILR